MARTLSLLFLASLLLSACGGRFAGFGSCSADGSPVWFEYPNSQGSYDGLNNGPQNCLPKK
jgi:hypothetical protein